MFASVLKGHIQIRTQAHDGARALTIKLLTVTVA